MKNQRLVALVLSMLVCGCGKEEAPPPAPLPEAPPGLPAAAAAPAQAATQDLGSLGALAGFEGEIGLLARSADTKKPIPPITVMAKDAKLRFGVPEGIEGSEHFGKSVHVIVDAREKKLMAVVDDKKQVIVLQLDQLGEQIKSFAPPASARPNKSREDEAPPRVTKTGRSSTVAGLPCEDWEIIAPNGQKTVLCVANQGASWFEIPTLGLPSEHTWARELFDGHHLPLRAISFDEKGVEEGRLEVTKLEQKPISEAMFAPPPGYKTIDVAQMMKGLSAAAAAAMKMPTGPDGKGKVPPNLEEMMKKMREQMKAAKEKQGK